MTKTKSNSSRPRFHSHFKIEEVTMKPLNETMPNTDTQLSTNRPTLLYHDIDLESIQREDKAAKAKKIQPTYGPPLTDKVELTYPPVSHGKSPYFS